MKNTALVATFLLATFLGYSQIPSYYNDVDLTLSGQSLMNELSEKVTNTHTNFLSYTPGVWDALKQTDVNPSNGSQVILIYGYNDSDGNNATDRTRGVDENGGSSGNWNREHVYPKSLGNPDLGTSGPGADAHHLRPSDISANSSRSNRRFADGSGNAGITSQGDWYPGDEFKGDVARMMMYMYIRYGSRCLPSNVGVGTTVSNDANMINLFLEWNAEDPVSQLEEQRNPILENLQGNRNPFIDNPAFATQIWGGPQAEDLFGDDGDTGGGNGNTLCSTTVTSFPYSESFESGFGQWRQATTDDFNWATNSGTTPSSNTGPGSAVAGSSYIYMESSTPNYSNKDAILYSPCYDITNANEANFSFQYHMYGASSMGSLSVEISLNGTSWTPIWSVNGNQGNAWQDASINLSSYIGEKIQLRFNGVTGTTWQGDMAVDDISFSTSGSGTGGGTTEVTLTITFDNYPGETSWQIIGGTGSEVYSGGSYGSQSNGSTINLSRTLDDDCYTFVMYDTYGDGICCSYGNGSYRLTDAIGTVLVSGGTFSNQDTTAFCVGASSKQHVYSSPELLDKEPIVIDFELYPSPAKSIINFKTTMSGAAYSITNNMGQVVLHGQINSEPIFVGALPSGIYFATVLGKDNQITIIKKFLKE